MSLFHRTTDLQSLLADAVIAIAKDDDRRALRLFEEAARRDGRNPMHRLRAADCLARLGRHLEAVEAYKEVAERYAAAEQWVRAVSVYRIVRRLAPQDLAAEARERELRRARAAELEPTIEPWDVPEPSPREWIAST